MDGFSYVDIFATKGVEYLLVLAFLAVLLLFWRFLNAPAGKQAALSAEVLQPAVADAFMISDEILYAPGHSWVALNDGRSMPVGLNGFLGRLIGRADSIDLPEPGVHIEKGQTLFAVGKGDRKLEIAAPLSGTVHTVNKSLSKDPSLIGSESPAWIVRMKPQALGEELRGFKSCCAAKSWIESEFNRFRDFLSSLSPRLAAAGQTLLDGGLPAEGALWQLPEQDFDEFNREFIHVE